MYVCTDYVLPGVRMASRETWEADDRRRQRKTTAENVAGYGLINLRMNTAKGRMLTAAVVKIVISKQFFVKLLKLKFCTTYCAFTDDFSDCQGRNSCVQVSK